MDASIDAQPLSNRLVLKRFLEHPFVRSLVSSHPNAFGLDSMSIPQEWGSWWEWAGYAGTGGSRQWKTVLRAYGCDLQSGGMSSVDESITIPPEIQDLVQLTRQIDLDRQPTPGNFMSEETQCSLRGMSPKKSHEVIRMTNYVKNILSRPEFAGVTHVVDIGAGQGYLSRALRDLGLHVLALDNDASQTEGAKRREFRGSKNASRQQHPTRHDSHFKAGLLRGSIHYKTVHVTPDSLHSAVSSWISDLQLYNRPVLSQCGAAPNPVPVVFVALHACGSLTLDIFRTFISCPRPNEANTDGAPAAANQSYLALASIIVPCCYNLMSAEEDFPLSKTYSNLPRLTSNHLQLAAQIPARWLDTPQTAASAELSLKKVVYRALLEAYITPATQDGMDPVVKAPHKRLGRLNDSAYSSLPGFLSYACNKLGIELPPLAILDGVSYMPGGGAWLERKQRQLEVLHVLRCILGPSIEAAIISDRVAWLRECLGWYRGRVLNQSSQATEHIDNGYTVDLIGLFDQAAGSARNFAIVISPRKV